MKTLAKTEQNYFVVAIPFLQLWFEKMQKQAASGYPVTTKVLPCPSYEEEKLDIDFSTWNVKSNVADLVIEECLWGVRCGIAQYLDTNACSLAAVLEVAKTDQMCEIYSPAKIQYFSDGSRRVVAHQLSAYNTDAKFACWHLIDLAQAKNLFPQYLKVLEKIPDDTKFLCSPDGTKIRVANQEVGEIGFNFNYVDLVDKDISFCLGNLRASFEYIASEIKNGKGKTFCNQEQYNHVDYAYANICFLAGVNAPYEKAMSLATETDAEEIRKIYIKNGLNGKRDFTVLINGKFVDNDESHNKFVQKEGGKGVICVAPSVYESWGKPFSVEELGVIYAPKSFNFDEASEKYYFCKANKLRYNDFQIGVYKSQCKNPIIEIETMDEALKKQLLGCTDNIKRISQSAASWSQHRVQDLSGPSRSSMYTSYYKND